MPHLRPDEHFVLVGAGQGLPRDRARAQGRAWATSLGFRDISAEPARLLSGGTRPKLNLVLATLTGPTCSCSTSRARASTGVPT